MLITSGLKKTILVIGLFTVAGVVGYLVLDDGQDVDISQWKTFTNTKHGYTFRYPRDIGEPITDCHAPCPELEGDNIHVFSKHGEIFFVDAQEPKNSWGIKRQTEIINLDLRSFTEEVWKLNREYTAGDIAQTKIANWAAYQFSTVGYTDGFSSFVFLNETSQKQRQMNVFVADSRGRKFIIHFPMDDKNAQQIVKTFKFL